MKLFTILLGLVPAMPALGQAANRIDPAQAEFFETKVRPILSSQCQSCHGTKQQLGGLSLDSRAAAIKGGGRGASIVAGRSEESLLIRAIGYRDDKLKMPPAGPLKPDQVALLNQRGKQGAPW